MPVTSTQVFTGHGPARVYFATSGDVVALAAANQPIPSGMVVVDGSTTPNTVIGISNGAGGLFSYSGTSAQGLAASRPAAAVGNNGMIYYSNDTGALEISNGTSWINVNNGVPVTTWTAAGTATNGLIKLLDLTTYGMNKNVLMIGDGTYWQPLNGKALMYSLTGTLLGTNANPSVITLPSVTLPGGLMNISGGFEVEFESWVTDGTAATANTVNMSYGGFELFGTDQGANGRLWEGRRVRNQGVANTQVVMANASATGAFIAANNTPKTTNRNSANDLTLTGTITTTTGGARTAQLDEYKVYWVA